MPSRFEEIMGAADAWWQTEGATVTAVPLIEDRARKVRVNINLNSDLLAAIDRQARARGMTRSAFLASAATRELVGGCGVPGAHGCACVDSLKPGLAGWPDTRRRRSG